ncbi:SurA N-terminal domain-containing protein [Streptomyces sp. NPDC088197]|uniref:SurA N-terminal domain-containing protein n=1 Tax=unclassified Streptomyces TaxID=2593676 RepID=UPI0033A689AF
MPGGTMVRRRTAVSIAAAALLAASPALTACGSGPAHPGAAAVVGDQKISIATLQHEVDQVRDAQSKSPQAAQLIGQSGKLPQQTLSMLVQNKVIDKAVSDAGLSVSTAEVQQSHAQALQQFGGDESQFEAALLQQYDIVPSGIDTFLRTNIAVGKLIQSLGFQPGSDTGNAAAIAVISKTAKSLGVDVNPRYGTWDAKKAIVGATNEPWVVTKTATPADPSA